MASFTSLLRDGVTLLRLFATPSRFRTPPAHEAMTALNSNLGTSASTVHFERSRKNRDALPAKACHQPLSIRTLQYIQLDLLVLHVCVGQVGFSRCLFAECWWRPADGPAPLLTRRSETMQKSIHHR